MLNSLDVVFRLKTWTIYRRKGAFYITDEERPPVSGKKYKSLRNACTAIARKLEKEFTERARRYETR